MERKLDLTGPKVEEAVRAIGRRTDLKPTVGVILGSGQGGFSRRLTQADRFPFHEIPHFYQPMVAGHEGLLTVGRLGGKALAVMEGRIHLYEGYFLREVVFPIRVLHSLGVRDIIVCNASGGLSGRLAVGQVMVVADHLNLLGDNPLVGQMHQDRENPFLDMVDAYDQSLRRLAAEVGLELGEELPEGVLAAVVGPCYETPAESRMLALLGADAVTMSSVPEVIMARFLGMRVLCLSLITNVHAPPSATSHGDVLRVAYGRASFLMELIARVAIRLAPVV